MTKLLLCVFFLIVFTSCEKFDSTISENTFLASSKCISGYYNYPISIKKHHRKESEIEINNLFEKKQSVKAKIEGNIITIPEQIIDGLLISGIGLFAGKSMTIKYLTNHESKINSCTIICSKIQKKLDKKGRKQNQKRLLTINKPIYNN